MNRIKTRKIGWGYHEDLYSAALILTEKDIQPKEDIQIEPLNPRKPFIRVSNKVVKRRKDESL